MSDMGKELVESGLLGFYFPIDRDNAKILFLPNSREVFWDNYDMILWWKILPAAKENWTIPSEIWEAVDWGVVTGNHETSKIPARRKK